MPGPIVPRPAPTPSAIDLIALAVSWLPPAWARRLVMVDMGSPLVAFGGRRAAEIDGCKRGEDERLQGRDQHDLEEVERHRDDGGRHDAERGQAEQRHEAAGHEQDQQVAGEQVGEEPHRQRDDPDEVGDQLDHEDRDAHAARRAGGDEGGEVAAHAVRPDALDVVADPHDEGEHERHRDVRRGRVQRERRDLQPEEVEGLLAVRRQRQIADQVREPDEEEEGAHEREPFGGHLRVHVPARDVVVREVVGGLDGGLDVVRLLLHALGDVDHRDARERRGQEQVEDGLVDAQVEPAELDRDPRVELELVLRLVLVVLAGAARGDAQDDRDQEQGPECERDLLAGAEVLEPGHGRVGPLVSYGRIASVIVNWSVKTARNSTAALRPAVLLPSPTAMMIPATSQPRPIMLPARMPTFARGSSAWFDFRIAYSPMRRWIAHAPAPVTQPRIGRPATAKMTSASASTGTSILRRTRTDVGVSEGIRACAGKTRSEGTVKDYPPLSLRERGVARSGRLPSYGRSARDDARGRGIARADVCRCSWKMLPSAGVDCWVRLRRPGESGPRTIPCLRTL